MIQWLHLSVVWLKKGPFCSHFDICIDTVCLFPENSTSFEYFMHVKMFLILCYPIYFDQGKHSCPVASCVTINFEPFFEKMQIRSYFRKKCVEKSLHLFWFLRVRVYK